MPNDSDQPRDERLSKTEMGSAIALRCRLLFGEVIENESLGSEPVVEETDRVRYRDKCKTNMKTSVVFSGIEQSKITLDVCVDVSKASRLHKRVRPLTVDF